MNKTVIILLVLVLLCATQVVTIRHQNRLAFIRLQGQQDIRDDLQMEWNRLMLEKATWTVEQSIAEDATQRLRMSAPAPDEIVMIPLKRVSVLIPQAGN